MTKQVDFRSSRRLLPPEAFAIAGGSDLPPKDLIDEDVWNCSFWWTDRDLNPRSLEMLKLNSLTVLMVSSSIYFIEN